MEQAIEYALELLLTQYRKLTLTEAVKLLESEFNIKKDEKEIKNIFGKIILKQNLDSFDVESRRIEFL